MVLQPINCKDQKNRKKRFKVCADALRFIKEEGNVSLLVVGNTESENFPEELREYTTRKEIENRK